VAVTSMANSSIRDFQKFNTMSAFGNLGFPVSYLVVAGGGAGGRYASGNLSGGGGAGGYRTNAGTSGGGAGAEADLFLSKGVHSIIVGAGGSSSSTTNWTSGF